MSGGVKFDQGKVPWRLFPWDAAGEVVKVLAYGARKYTPRNWERGMLYSRVYDAMLRHATAWWQGENEDPETGLNHMAHVACCAFFLLAYETRSMRRARVLDPETETMTEADDRPLVRLWESEVPSSPDTLRGDFETPWDEP